MKAFRVIIYGILHLIFWLITMYAFVVFFSMQSEEVFVEINGAITVERTYNKPLQMALLCGGLVKIEFFYLHTWVLVSLLFQKQWVKYFPRFLALLIISILTERWIHWHFLAGELWAVPAQYYIISYLFYAFVSFMLGWYKEKNRAEKAKLSMESSATKLELEMLKSQFDPHFVFNSLNSVMWLAEKEGSTAVANSLEDLSVLLRAVVDTPAFELIPIEKEVDLMEKYIALYRLKFDQSDQISISFNNELSYEEMKTGIRPFVLLPFIENACKHGLSFYEDSYIEISLGMKENILEFEVANTKHEENMVGVSSTKLGLTNMKRRLALYYPDKHKLEIESRNGLFILNLALEL